jgi:site-specific DNA-methyltransferase (adenine-specific)
VLTHGTGALNIDASRIDGVPPSKPNPELGVKERITYGFGTGTGRNGEMSAASGRWPANILLDEEAAALLDEQSGESKSMQTEVNTKPSESPFLASAWRRGQSHGDSGGASRFFYVAKASRSERNAGLDGFDLQDAQRWNKHSGIGNFYPDGTPRPRSPERNTHPTVKPVDLMRYLIRLVTPKGGTVLDPFMGSGTTAVAAIQEGANWIGCEREPEYVAIIEARIAAAQPGMGLNLEEETQ